MDRDDFDLDDALRKAFAARPGDETRSRHLAAMKAAFTAPEAAPQPVRRRGPFVRRVTIASAAFVLVGGSALAATGTLPAPAQNAVAKVAHGVGLSLPHSTQVTNPRAVTNPGVRFANAKKAWLDCERSGATSCGPQPKAQDFVHHPASSASPEASEAPGEGHGRGAEHRHTPDVTKSPQPTDEGGGHASPEPSRTPNPHAHGNADGNAAGHGDGHGGPQSSDGPGD